MNGTWGKKVGLGRGRWTDEADRVTRVPHAKSPTGGLEMMQLYALSSFSPFMYLKNMHFQNVLHNCYLSHQGRIEFDKILFTN